ncbi:MAG: hypothetical protein PHW52_01150 [Candidatus Pacebacteria bacterium]|nr:hypothetical protein [Candidatus Paceibacterota bacterium]
MNIKNMLPFREYYRRYITTQNCDELFCMLLAARSFYEWAKVYRNYYWVSLKRTNCVRLDMLEEIRMLCLRQMLSSAPSKDELLNELMRHDDLFIVGDITPLEKDELSRELVRLSSEYYENDTFSNGYP